MGDLEFTVFLRQHIHAGNLNMRERRDMKRPPRQHKTRSSDTNCMLQGSRWMVSSTDFTTKRCSMTNGKTMLHARQNIFSKDSIRVVV